jgi:hypothetical protein
MPSNIAGLSGALNAVNQLSLHSANPGIGVNPAAGELTTAPYARQACVFNAGVANGAVAEALLNADVSFDLSLSVDQNVQFIGMWEGATYKGYIVPTNPNNFTGTATTRTFTVTAATTKITAANV